MTVTIAETEERLGWPEGLDEKLHPARFPNMSPRMSILVDWIFGNTLTEEGSDRFVDLCVTSDGMLMAQQEGQVGMNDFVGAIGDFDRNIEELLGCIDDELTDQDREWVRNRVNSIRRF